VPVPTLGVYIFFDNQAIPTKLGEFRKIDLGTIWQSLSIKCDVTMATAFRQAVFCNFFEVRFIFL